MPDIRVTPPHPVSDAETDRPCLQIVVDGRAGRLAVGDARLFGPSGRPLGRRLVRALRSHPGVRRAEVDSRAASCFVDFDLGSNTAGVMAGVFIDSLRRAVAGGGRRCGRPSEWSSVVAYRHHGAVWFWEVTPRPRGGVRLVRDGLPREGCGGVAALADRVAALDGVERCVVSRWSRRLTVVLGRDDAPSVRRTVSLIEAIVEGRLAPAPLTAHAEAPASTLPPWKRWVDVGLGGARLRWRWSASWCRVFRRSRFCSGRVTSSPGRPPGSTWRYAAPRSSGRCSASGRSAAA